MKQADPVYYDWPRSDAGQPRHSKYNAVRSEVDGRKFASRKEANRYQELCLLQYAGKIDDLTCQVKLSCTVNGVKVCDYIADFVYLENGAKVYEDVKGYKTPLYRLKKKLVHACLGIELRET